MRAMVLMALAAWLVVIAAAMLVGISPVACFLVAGSILLYLETRLG